MMKKVLLFTLLTVLAVPLANAQTDKIKHCPSVDQIKITRVQKPWTHYYSAYNDDMKYFVSKEYTEVDHNDTKAIADYTTAMKLDPKMPEPHFSRAVIYESQKKYSQALADFKMASKLGMPGISEDIERVNKEIKEANKPHK